MPGRYRKKPVVVEAVRLSASLTHAVAEWCNGTAVVGGVIVPTLEGPLRASVGDWVIRGVRGEFYPCRRDIFEETYEEVIDDAE